MLKAHESQLKVTDLSSSIGLTIHEDGAIQDVVPGSAPDKAGVALPEQVKRAHQQGTPKYTR